MKRTSLFLSCLVAACFVLSACSQQEPAASAPASAKRSPSIPIVAAEAKGFSVGAMMSANAVYVFFDPQCPHCAHLWAASIPLQQNLKFIWIPVGFINASSSSQGAALLAASDPAQAMAEHEKSILAGQGGISGVANASPEMAQAVKNNTQLFNNFGIESVPFVIARNARTGLTVTHLGSMTTAALAELLGVDPG